jgi:hypothetical protein
MDARGDGGVDAAELASWLRARGYRPRRGEAAEMVWEVDEDRDGRAGWAEFAAAYARCATDRDGAEPRPQLFAVAQFALHAGPGAAALAPDRAARLHYLRGGRAALEGGATPEAPVSLAEFVAAASREHVAAGRRARVGGGAARAARRPAAETLG